MSNMQDTLVEKTQPSAEVVPDTSRLQRLVFLGVAGVVFLIVQWPQLRDWWKVWEAPYSYFSHGPLVPFIAAYMVWANRKRLAAVQFRYWWPGCLVLLISVAMLLTGNWIESASLRAGAFLLMIFGILLSLIGPSATRVLVVPVLFLVTMIPLAPSVLDSATGRLQIQSAAVAAKVFRLTGHEAQLQGSTIYSSDLPEPLIVGIPCSGLRTLISLTTFTIFFIYLIRAAWWKKAVLLAMAFPLSILTNSLRIAMIGYVGFFTGSAEAMHKFHDYSGYIGLAICFGILFGIAKLIKANTFGLQEPKTARASVQVLVRRPVHDAVVGILAIVLVGGAGLAQAYGSPLAPKTKGHIDRSAIPMAFGKWVGQDAEIDKLTREWLKSGDLLHRVYVEHSDYGREVDVFITASKDPDAFHDPHMCLQGGGSPISDDKLITLKFTRPKPIVVRATFLESANDYDHFIVVYWYMLGTDSMPRTSDVWAKNRAELVKDLKWLILHPGGGDELKKRVESRQFKWYRFSTMVLNDTQADLRYLKEFIREFVAHTKDFGK
ncbi:MAG: exosortase [Armatimonadota bacterium]|nr:exosortase [Armatimonadota bacterium]